MGKLILIALLAGGGWWAWQNGLVPVPAELREPTPAFQAYTHFSTYLVHAQYGNARKLAARGAVRSVQIRELQGRRNTQLAVSGRSLTKDDKLWGRKGDVTGVTHQLITESTSTDGSTVTIQAIERRCRERSGCEDHQHDVEMCLVGEAWKVCSFRESEASAADLAAR